MLGAENQGVLTVFVATGQIIALAIGFGLPGGMTYFIGQNRNLFSPVILNCSKLVFTLLIVFALLLYLLPIDRFAQFLSIHEYFPLLFISVFFLTYFSIFEMAILSLKKYFYYNIFAFGAGFLVFSFSVLIFFAPLTSKKLDLAIIAYITTYGVLFIYGAIIIFIERRKIRDTGEVQSFWEQCKVGFRGFISSIAGLLLFRLDLFLVGYFLTLREVGIYSIALFSAEMVTKIPGWSANILTPIVASNEVGHVRRTIYLFYSSVIVASFLGAFLLFGIFAFSNLIAVLIGKDFTGVESCLMFLLPRVIMQSGVSILAANLAGKGYPWYHPLGCVVPLLLLILLDIVLIPLMGINGAALGNSLAYISAAVIFWVGFHKYNEVEENINMKSYVEYVRSHLHGQFSAY